MSSVALRYENENFSYVIEEYKDVCFVHCEVFNWNKTVYKEILSMFISTTHKYKDVLCYTPNIKFAKMFGFNSIGSFTEDNKTYEVMICHKQHYI